MEIQVQDGIYLEIFIVKDGKRYNYKTVSLKRLRNALVDSVTIGLESVVEVREPEKEEGDALSTQTGKPK